jgi:hypothetical protein
MSRVNNEFKMASCKCAFLDLAASLKYHERHLGTEQTHTEVRLVVGTFDVSVAVANVSSLSWR